jgi:hypothetical protein
MGWKILKIAGYVLIGVYGIDLLYALVLYGIRHEGWFFLYNPNFGSHSNSELAWRILWSTIVILAGWGLTVLSRRKLKGPASTK